MNLASGADQVTVTILNSSGQVIQTETLGAQKAGIINFAWDGATSSGTTATDGAYTFKVEAVQGSNAVTRNGDAIWHGFCSFSNNERLSA